VVNQTFDLMDKLGANEEQLDFPVVYASALNGWASREPGVTGDSMRPLFDAILEHVPEPAGDPDGSLQLQISAVDYSTFLGRIAVGRIRRGTLRKAQDVIILSGDAPPRKARIGLVRAFQGLEKVEMDSAAAGEIVSVTGIEDFTIGATFADVEKPEALPFLGVDEPTLTMNFQVNTSPFAGQEGKYVTSRQIRDRLTKELLANVALRVEDTGDADIFRVSGRGELHLTILIENMRREGYELAVGKPRVVVKEIDGVKQEPWEILTIDVEQDHQGRLMEELGRRGGELQDMVPDGKGRVRLDYKIPSRGLIGFHMEFMTITRGTGIKSTCSTSTRR
jgi:GTP-binding protein